MHGNGYQEFHYYYYYYFEPNFHRLIPALKNVLTQSGGGAEQQYEPK